MKSVKHFFQRHEKSVLGVAIYIFFFATIVLSAVAPFVPAVRGYKQDIILVLLMSAVIIVFNFVKDLYSMVQAPKPQPLIPYTSQATNLTEIELVLEQHKTCQLLVLGNTLTTMWNSLLKHHFNRIRTGNVSAKLTVKIVKQVRSMAAFKIEEDPVISQIREWFAANKTTINITVFITENPTYFTGICLNDEFLKYRFLNKETRRELIGKAEKGPNEIENRTIEWFTSAFSDICSRSKSVFESKGF